MVVPEQSINNIMGGLESTGGVTLHNHRRKLKQRFDIVKKLGQGTYGKVQLGLNKETNQAVAIKTIKKCKIQTEADLIRIRREIQIMSSLRHPYIIHIYEVFENKDKMVLVMEYAAGGELYDYLNTQKTLDEGEARRIFRQIAMAVFYCHKYQICHRDLKLENILLDENGNAKIADFGLSNVFDQSRLLSTFCGSPLYASPEIVRGIPYIGPEVDCWSLGVLLYTLVYRAMPFDGSNFKQLVMMISIGAYYEPKDDKSSASTLIRSLLTVNPNTRLTIADVCKHPWMNQEGKVSCYRLAEELALEPPNRLDLLLALATPPQTTVAEAVPEEASLGPSQESAPPRSMSLGNLSAVQHSATYTAVSTATPQPKEPAEDPAQPAADKKPSEGKERKRDRSRSKSRKKDVGTDEAKKKSNRTKKKSSAEEIPSKEELSELLDDALKISSELEVKEAGSAVTDEATPQGAEVVEKDAKESTEPKEQIVESSKEVARTEEDPTMPETKTEPSPEAEEKVEPVKDSPSINKVSNEVRRKSEAFEQGEIQTPTAAASKKRESPVARHGVSVSDARAAFERRSSADVRAPSTKRASPIKKPEFALASAVNVTDIVKAELGSEADAIIAPTVEPQARPETSAPEEPVKKDDEVKLKKENAIKVISHAISESELNEKKASTLPRRRLSRPSVSQPCSAEPQHVVGNANSKASQFVYPSVPPVPAPRPSLIKQESAPAAPKERIIPIFVEKREKEETAAKDRPQQVSRQGSASSSARSSTSSLGRQDSTSSTLSASTSATTTTATAEPIRKSPREVIIPIAVEGGGIVTPSEQTLSKMNLSVSEDEEAVGSVPLRSFGLHSTRPRHLDSADSVSSDEDDDNFEVLSTENLFSTLLARMRNLTQNLDHGRPAFPKLFHNPLFEPRRLTETKSFTDADPTPWRRKSSAGMASSSATLPRGFTNKAFRRIPTRDDLPPPASTMSTARRLNRTVSDSLQNGFDSAPLFDDAVNLAASASSSVFNRLSSLERVKRYLDDINRSEFRRPCRSVYVPGMSQTSEFDKFRQATRCNGGGGVASGPSAATRGPALNAYDKIKELREYHNNRKSLIDENKSHESDPPPKKEENKSVLEKYLYGEPKPKKQSRFLNKPEGSKKKEESRVDKTIKALRRNSIGIENAFSESKLLKRAVSLEDISAEAPPTANGNNRNKRASSLKPDESSSPFEKKETVVQRKKGGVFDAIKAAKEKLKLDLAPPSPQYSFNSAETTPTGDQDDTRSFASNSDTWSSSDPTERFFDAAEDCVSERIRRKSFYLRFNLPKRNGSFHKSASNSDRKRYF